MEWLPVLPSTPEQVRDMHELVTEVSKLQGTYCFGENLFGDKIDDLPNEVRLHMPIPDPSCLKVQHFVSVSQKVDRATGEPRAKGPAGKITFSQHETVQPKLAYITDVNYLITRPDESLTFDIERHVAVYAQGPSVQVPPRTALEKYGALVNAATSVQRLDTIRSLEVSTGIMEVTGPEAQEILDFLDALSGR